MLKKEIMAIIKPHRETTIDIKSIKLIDNGGYNILQVLKNIAERSRCKIRFINVEAGFTSLISDLTDRKIQTHKEFKVE